MEGKFFLYEREGAIVTLTVNRPEALNAMNPGSWNELGEWLKGIGADPTARVILLTGAGEKAFIAGSDIVDMDLMSVAEARGFAMENKQILDLMAQIPQVVIACINGHALGGGCEIAMACDLRIASKTARLGQPETGLGIIPGSGGTQRLPRLVGLSRAKFIVLQSLVMTAEEAQGIGLVDMVTEREDLMDTAKKIADKIASRPAVATRLAKASLNASQELSLNIGLAYEVECFAQCFDSEDKKEAFAAFLEKRPAKPYAGK